MKRILGKTKRAVGGWLNDKLDKPIIKTDQKKQVIGKTVLGKNIETFFIGNSPKKILFIFGIHGNEVGTVKLGHRFLNYADQLQSENKNVSFVIIPCLNLDGYAKAISQPDYFAGGRIGRFNGNNVDLNRNFKTESFQKHSNWTHGKNYQEKTSVYCGERGNSEPEIKAVIDLAIEEKISYIFIFHNAGADVVGAKDALSQKLAYIYAKHARFEHMSNDSWKALGHTGTPKEWCEEHKISFLEIEGTNRWKSDWNRQKPAIQALVEYINKSN